MNVALIDALVSPLGWTLLHFIWQGLLIGVLHEIAIRFSSRRTPGFRYAVSLLAMLALVVAPVATFIALWMNTVSGETAHVHAALPLADAVRAGTALEPVTGSVALVRKLDAWLPHVVLIWLIGVGLLSARFGLGLAALKRLVKQADSDVIADWIHEELARLSARMGIRRKVRIALSAGVGSPLVVGWLQPVILLPLSAATGLDAQQLRMVLAHELAHLRRHDHLVNLLQVVVETLLFYHPAVHRISRSLRQEREQCCDDLAAAIGGNRLAYARVLAELEEMRQEENRHALALGIADQELYTRIERLVGNAPGESSPERWLPVALITVAGLLAMSQTLDTDAPLFPDWFQASVGQQRIALDLPPRVSQPFTPIVDSAAAETSAPVAQPANRIAEDSRREPLPSAASATVKEPAAGGDEPATLAQQTLTEQPGVDGAGTQDAARAETNRAETTEMTPALTPAMPVRSGGEIVHAEEPAYPRRALRSGREGQVTLAFTITTEGDVKDVSVLAAEPRGFFETAAKNAISQWRYRPFMEDGVAVEQRVSQVMEFRLSDEPAQRGGTGAKDCREQTGTRLCRGAENGSTQLTILSE